MDKEAVGMERRAVVTEEMMAAGARSLIDGQENRPGSSWADEALWCYEAMHALAQQPAAQAVGLTNEQFIAAHGERLAAMLGIKEWWDIADRDARIKAALLSRAASSGEPVAVVRDNPDDIGTIIEGLVPLEVGTQLYAAPQPSAQQAEPTHLQRWSRVIKELPMAEQPAEEARGVDALTRFRYTERDGMVEDRAMGEWVLLDAVKALLAGPAAADARTQSGAHGLAPIHIGNLTTLNQDTYPGLGDWWVQLRIGSDFDEVLARVYGSSPEQARERAAILARAASEARAEGLTQAARDVLAERRRQIAAEGWTPEHDDQHIPGALAQAAACYIEWNGWETEFQREGAIPINWPWAAEWWKPSNDRRNLVKACALTLAEIERLDRALAAQKKGA